MLLIPEDISSVSLVVFFYCVISRYFFLLACTLFLCFARHTSTSCLPLAWASLRPRLWNRPTVSTPQSSCLSGEDSISLNTVAALLPSSRHGTLRWHNCMAEGPTTERCPKSVWKRSGTARSRRLEERRPQSAKTLLELNLTKVSSGSSSPSYLIIWRFKLTCFFAVVLVCSAFFTSCLRSLCLVCVCVWTICKDVKLQFDWFFALIWGLNSSRFRCVSFLAIFCRFQWFSMVIFVAAIFQFFISILTLYTHVVQCRWFSFCASLWGIFQSSRGRFRQITWDRYQH